MRYWVYEDPAEPGRPLSLVRVDDQLLIERASRLEPRWVAVPSLYAKLFGEDNMNWNQIDRPEAEVAAKAIGVGLTEATKTESTEPLQPGR